MQHSSSRFEMNMQRRKLPTETIVLVPLTHVASKWSFLGAMCPLEGTTAFATSSRIFTCNGILAMVYLQWFTCEASFHPIEIMITSSHTDIYMKAYEILRITVKTV